LYWLLPHVKPGPALSVSRSRLAPGGDCVARAIGAVVVGSGLLLIAQAAGLG
jgi:hypothetical protein